jgi:hypothetical protein
LLPHQYDLMGKKELNRHFLHLQNRPFRREFQNHHHHQHRLLMYQK